MAELLKYSNTYKGRNYELGINGRLSEELESGCVFVRATSDPDAPSTYGLLIVDSPSTSAYKLIKQEFIDINTEKSYIRIGRKAGDGDYNVTFSDWREL